MNNPTGESHPQPQPTALDLKDREAAQDASGLILDKDKAWDMAQAGNEDRSKAVAYRARMTDLESQPKSNLVLQPVSALRRHLELKSLANKAVSHNREAEQKEIKKRRMLEAEMFEKSVYKRAEALGYLDIFKGENEINELIKTTQSVIGGEGERLPYSLLWLPRIEIEDHNKLPKNQPIPDPNRKVETTLQLLGLKKESVDSYTRDILSGTSKSFYLNKHVFMRFSRVLKDLKVIETYHHPDAAHDLLRSPDVTEESIVAFGPRVEVEIAYIDDLSAESTIGAVTKQDAEAQSSLEKWIDDEYQKLATAWDKYGIKIPEQAGKLQEKLVKAQVALAELTEAKPELFGRLGILLVPPTEVTGWPIKQSLRKTQGIRVTKDEVHPDLVQPKASKDWRVLVTDTTNAGIYLGSAEEIIQDESYKTAGQDTRALGIAEYAALTLQSGDPIDQTNSTLLLKDWSGPARGELYAPYAGFSDGGFKFGLYGAHFTDGRRFRPAVEV